jgi:hypothetical protein
LEDKIGTSRVDLPPIHIRAAEQACGFKPHPVPPRANRFPRRCDWSQEKATMTLPKDKAEWELPHFKEAHQMQVSNTAKPFFECPCVTSAFRLGSNVACVL